MEKVLIVARDIDLQRRLTREVDALGRAFVVCASLGEGCQRAREGRFGLIVVLATLAHGSRDEAATLGRLAGSTPILLLTSADAGSGDAPSFEPAQVETLTEPISGSKLRDRLVTLLSAASPPPAAAGAEAVTFVGTSAAAIAIRERLTTLADNDLPVALYGESGTGKELGARMLHSLSPRSGRPLVIANCASIPETLFENELFGHEKGAFTGAHRRSDGLLAQADGGTLVLDEIGELPLNVQAKLLRVLQFGSYRRVGANTECRADLRLIVATNRDLQQEVRAGRFRGDLYYRVNVLHATMPSLRDRSADIPALVNHIAAQFCDRYARAIPEFSADAMRVLCGYSWPGNVRELEAIVQSALALQRGPLVEAAMIELPRVSADASVLQLDDLLDPSLSYSDARGILLERFERRYLRHLMSTESGNLAAAARTSGADRKSLWRLLKKYDMDLNEFRTLN